MTTVLLAEDDPAIAEPLARALEREGYSVEVRSDGPDRGTEFIVRIPLASEDPGATHREGP